MIDLPYYEDIYYIYIKYIYETLFPPVKGSVNKTLVYLSSFLHLIGTIMISIGIFWPPEYMGIYLLYISLILLSYIIFRGHCFMTLFANKYSGLTSYPLHIRLSTARKALMFNICIAIIGLLYPKYSLYALISKIFNYSG